MSASDVLKAAGFAESHWGSRIIKAEGRGSFLGADNADLSGWANGPCAMLEGFVEVDAGTGEPIDPTLRKLALDFAVFVRENEMELAAQQLVDLEVRIAALCVAAADTKLDNFMGKSLTDFAEKCAAEAAPEPGVAPEPAVAPEVDSPTAAAPDLSIKVPIVYSPNRLLTKQERKKRNRGIRESLRVHLGRDPSIAEFSSAVTDANKKFEADTKRLKLREAKRSPVPAEQSTPADGMGM